MTATLHELCGHGWRLPVYAETQSGGLIEVKLACALPKVMTKTAVAALENVAEYENNGAWYLTRTALDQCTIPSQFTEPEDVIVWKGSELELPDKIDDFTEAYTKSRHAFPQPVFQNKETFHLIWKSITNFMLDWMLFKDGEVDLGFARLNAFCMRANWKNIVVGRIAARKLHYQKTIMQDAARREIARIFHLDYLTAWNKNTNTIRWSLDIAPTADFHQAVYVREIKRKAEKHSISSYLAKVLKLLRTEKNKTRLYEALLSYARETYFPYISLPYGGENGCKGKSSQPPATINPPPKWKTTPVVIGATKKDGRTLAGEDESLLEVQDLLALSEDLRIAGENVDSAGADDAPAARLLMFLARKKSNGRKLLAGGANGNDDGLAESVEHGEPDLIEEGPAKEPGETPPDSPVEDQKPD